MRFLANENLPGPSILLIRQHGHDVMSVAEIQSGITDHEVVELARIE
ncbi:MAG: DUF5615 family PIN-like protein [Bacteroidia bacterium]|nr:DUF5615 family PIN-like protein [Bacteroidia bacterium]